MSTSACSNQDFDDKSQPDIFEEFWSYVDQHYIYFEIKEVDWTSIKEKYSAQINDDSSDDSLFGVMEAALLELKDGHNRLERSGQLAEKYDYKDGYEIHFDGNVIKDNYMKEAVGVTEYLYWGMVEDNVGYVSLTKFKKYKVFRSVFEEMSVRKVDKLVIDMRSNSGGDETLIPELFNILVKEKTTLGAYIEKSGPEHNDVTDLLPVYSEEDPDFYFDIPIVVLINRGSFSATSYFASMIKGLENVTLMGQITGGGGGGNLGYQLSNGWVLAVSASDFQDKNGLSIEQGVQPDVYIENTKEDIENGVDKMLEMAIEF